MEIFDEINDVRGTDADYHLHMARNWRRFGETELSHSPLIYAALELRLGIERFVFELYYLIKKDELFDMSGFDESEFKKIDRFNSLLAVLYENVGNKQKLYKAFLFNKNHVRIFLNIPLTLSVPDLGILHNYWQKLSQFCHKQFAPSETWKNENWVRLGYKLLNEVEDYFWKLIGENKFGWIEVESLPKELKELREKFIVDEINENQLLTRMELIKPVLESRKA